MIGGTMDRTPSDSYRNLWADPIAATVSTCVVAVLAVVATDLIFCLVTGRVMAGVPLALPDAWARAANPVDGRLTAQWFGILLMAACMLSVRLRGARMSRRVFSMVAGWMMLLGVIFLITPAHAAVGALLGLTTRCVVVLYQDLASGRGPSPAFWVQAAVAVGAVMAAGIALALALLVELALR